MSYCEDCGCKVYSGACTNCHEEVYIMEQIYELEDPIPVSDEFAEKVQAQKAEIKRRKQNETI